ncbi:aminotransferase [Armillaria mellea]|nr:aminotransferase [Armillaria mellea]
MSLWKSVGNCVLEGVSSVPDLDVSKLTIMLADSLKPVPDNESLVFGAVTTDHMLVVSFEPSAGWSTPEIKPYAPLSLDPMSSCFQYCTNLFEGMKAYIGPDGKPRLFRPEKNMARLARSAERVALPPFNTDALLALIKRLVMVEKRWIPAVEGHSLYIRPTIIGTRAALGVAASDQALLYVIVSPTGPYFRTGPKPLSLLAVNENVRAWPGGTGGHKLGLNYAPGFLPQRIAAKRGYDQILWLLGDAVTEAGAMNFFVVIKRDDDDGVDVATPELDGTILPGVTRMSVLELMQAHNDGRTNLNGLPKLHTQEKKVTMSELKKLSEEGKLLEAFGVGTAVIVAPVGKIGFEGDDLTLPAHEKGLGPVGGALWRRLVDIQEGRVQWENWGVLCEDA